MDQPWSPKLHWPPGEKLRTAFRFHSPSDISIRKRGFLLHSWSAEQLLSRDATPHEPQEGPRCFVTQTRWLSVQLSCQRHGSLSYALESFERKKSIFACCFFFMFSFLLKSNLQLSSLSLHTVAAFDDRRSNLHYDKVMNWKRICLPQQNYGPNFQCYHTIFF